MLSAEKTTDVKTLEEQSPQSIVEMLIGGLEEHERGLYGDR